MAPRRSGTRLAHRLALVALAWGVGACGASAETEDPCVAATSHLRSCLGEQALPDPTACDLEEAEAVVEMSCEELRARLPAGGKADGDDPFSEDPVGYALCGTGLFRLLTAVPSTMNGGPVVLDAYGRVEEMGGKALTYDAIGRVATIGASTVEYDWSGRPNRLNGAPIEYGFFGKVAKANGFRVRHDWAGRPIEINGAPVEYGWHGGVVALNGEPVELGFVPIGVHPLRRALCLSAYAGATTP
ncbi:MAG: hypothetical protein JRI23_09810 [Deltaproteobacteria bacterium]|jgi:hypothetical protein|nr:hypothetical protein [Deltaproteobacteria bacterium]MBW2531963.1 hypothetical protein [Deltaproteobacteria bacterium]